MPAAMLKTNWPMQLVHRVRREPSVSRTHTHIAGVFTDSGAYVSRAELIESLDGGELWWTEADGRRARISKVAHCHVPGCSLTPYVTTGPDHTRANNLENVRIADAVGPVMTPQHVVATTKETTWTGGVHRHVVVLRLEGGARIPCSTAIASIQSGLASYRVASEQGAAVVEAVARCVRCSRPYLRTTGLSGSELLLRLPDR